MGTVGSDGTQWPLPRRRNLPVRRVHDWRCALRGGQRRQEAHALPISAAKLCNHVHNYTSSCASQTLPSLGKFERSHRCFEIYTHVHKHAGTELIIAAVTRQAELCGLPLRPCSNSHLQAMPRKCLCCRNPNNSACASLR